MFKRFIGFLALWAMLLPAPAYADHLAVSKSSVFLDLKNKPTELVWLTPLAGTVKIDTTKGTCIQRHIAGADIAGWRIGPYGHPSFPATIRGSYPGTCVMWFKNGTAHASIDVTVVPWQR